MEFQFDVDLFDVPRERIQRLPSDYEVKICSAQWYLSAEGRDIEENIFLAKHAADYKFYNREYLQALDAYSRCIDLLSATNVAARRDCVEGKARCYLKLGAYDSALETAKELNELGVNGDHVLMIWRLLSEIHNAREDTEEEKVALCRCIGHHPESSAFWDRLSACYVRQVAREAALARTTAASLVRTSLLYQGSLSGNRSFARVHNLQRQKEIERLLDSLDLPTGFMEFARKELTAEDGDDDRAGDSAVVVEAAAPTSDTVARFEGRWFARLSKFRSDR